MLDHWKSILFIVGVDLCIGFFLYFGCECRHWMCVGAYPTNTWHQTDAHWWKIANQGSWIFTNIHFAHHLHPRASRKNARNSRAHKMVWHLIFLFSGRSYFSTSVFPFRFYSIGELERQDADILMFWISSERFSQVRANLFRYRCAYRTCSHSDCVTENGVPLQI